MPTPRRFSTLATFVALSFALALWPGAAGAGSTDRSGDHRAAALDQAVAYQNDSFHDGAPPARWCHRSSGSGPSTFPAPCPTL